MSVSAATGLASSPFHALYGAAKAALTPWPAPRPSNGSVGIGSTRSLRGVQTGPAADPEEMARSERGRCARPARRARRHRGRHVLLSDLSSYISGTRWCSMVRAGQAGVLRRGQRAGVRHRRRATGAYARRQRAPLAADATSGLDEHLALCRRVLSASNIAGNASRSIRSDTIGSASMRPACNSRCVAMSARGSRRRSASSSFMSATIGTNGSGCCTRRRSRPCRLLPCRRSIPAPCPHADTFEHHFRKLPTSLEGIACGSPRWVDTAARAQQPSLITTRRDRIADDDLACAEMSRPQRDPMRRAAPRDHTLSPRRSCARRPPWRPTPTARRVLRRRGRTTRVGGTSRVYRP